ncbi:MAG: hydroxymethylglutaryl-CoA lyase [Flavobacteriales bacterium]|nr:hydroxymethylglutaryl-CoA lyase [Flavobacteriales bacterium]
MQIKLTECPRDAMQGFDEFIPTKLKAKYINAILKVGFDVVDFGSFVSHKAIPQLKDTVDVLNLLDLSEKKSKLLTIVANERGATEAAAFQSIDVLGFPFSVSEKFQLRNTNVTRLEALDSVKRILDITTSSNKQLRIYLSMGFGNPYGEEYSPEIVLDWASRLREIGIEELALSDTIGVASKSIISPLFKSLKKELPSTEISAHFHSAPHNWQEKVDEAFKSGCFSFDSAIKGFGGCPLAEDDLVGNLATENLMSFFDQNLSPSISKENFVYAMDIANEVFG